jgi:twitching motility protein PilT
MITLRRSGLQKVMDGRHDDREVRARDRECKASANRPRNRLTWPHFPNCLKTLVENNGSILHITTDYAGRQIPCTGTSKPLDLPSLGPARDRRTCLQRAHRRCRRKRFEEALELDFSFGIRGIAGGPAAHVLQPARRRRRRYSTASSPSIIKGFNELGACRKVLAQPSPDRPRGLVLAAPGPTGSGKSTTLAAMIDKINTERHEHILTIEDPIEFVHQHKGCLVNQREVHQDTQGFANALRAALREDPDVVLIGELRDLETIESALRIAETGT